MNLVWRNGELIDAEAPVYVTTASDSTTSPPPPSAGLSEVLSDEHLRNSLDEMEDENIRVEEPNLKSAVIASYRALAQRLREVEQERDKARYDRDVAHDCLLKAFDLLAQLEARVAELEG
jgi:hypothetical protein